MADMYLDIDWLVNSIRKWASLWNEAFNLNFVVSRLGRLAAIYNSCLCSTPERLLATNFGEESKLEVCTHLNLLEDDRGDIQQC